MHSHDRRKSPIRHHTPDGLSMNYRYKALTGAGASLIGEMEALNRATVLQDLHQLGHFPIEVTEIKGATVGASQRRKSFFSGLPSARQITLFTRELSMLLKAGLPLDRALGFFRRVRAQKHSGDWSVASSPKSVAAKASAKHFNSRFPASLIYSRMVRVAETSGTLDTVLERIATGREKAQKLKSMALSEVLYPCLLIVMAISAVTIVLTVVVPRFKDMIGSAGTKVPRFEPVWCSAHRIGCWRIGHISSWNSPASFSRPR